MAGKFFDPVHEIYISGLKIIIFVTVKDIFDLENEKFIIFSPFLMIFMKFHELKYKFLNNYKELEYFENYVLILNLFVIDLEHQIYIICSVMENNFLTVTLFKFENYDRYIFNF